MDIIRANFIVVASTFHFISELLLRVMGLWLLLDAKYIQNNMLLMLPFVLTLPKS